MSLNPDKLKEEKFGKILLSEPDYDDYVIDHYRLGKVHIDSLEDGDEVKKRYQKETQIWHPRFVERKLDDVMGKYFKPFISIHGTKLTHAIIVKDLIKHAMDILNGKVEHSRYPELSDWCKKLYDTYWFIGKVCRRIVDEYDDQHIEDFRHEFEEVTGSEIDTIKRLFGKRVRKISVLPRPANRDGMGKLVKRTNIMSESSFILLLEVIALSDEFVMPSEIIDNIYNWVNKTGQIVTRHFLNMTGKYSPIFINYRNIIISEIERREKRGEKVHPEVKQAILKLCGGE